MAAGEWAQTVGIGVMFTAVAAERIGPGGS